LLLAAGFLTAGFFLAASEAFLAGTFLGFSSVLAFVAAFF
jgi:hypothetical protein